MEIVDIIKGILHNPNSENWRKEFRKLSPKDRNTVCYYVSLEEMGTGLNPEDYYSFWQFAKDENNGSQDNR